MEGSFHKRNEKDYYICVCCGEKTDTLYKRYSPELIEVSKCVSCGQIADSYIENDYIVILIDIILLRIQAFRHLIFNTDFREFWSLKLAAFSCLSEAYHHWALEHVDQQAITAAIELSFYIKLAAAVIGIVLQAALAMFLLWCISKTNQRSYEIHRLRSQCITLSNYSVLYLIVIHIWSPQSAMYGYYLLKLYKVATFFIALKAITGLNMFSLMFISTVSCGVDFLVNNIH